MKLTFFCFIPLVNIMATSARLTSHVEGQGGEMQRCNPDHNIQNGTEVWDKAGGFYYTNSGVNLFYTTEGSGDPIVLIHGWACDQSDWIFQIPFLLDHGFQVITIDQRGHGRSSTPVPATYTYAPETLAEDAAALLEYLHIGNGTARGAAIVMGHSLGGVVASELAFRHPGLVRALVLVESAYYTPISQFELISATLNNSSATAAPGIVASFFEMLELPVAERPAWIRAWRLRRTWGMPGHVVIAVLEQLTHFLGRWNTGIEYRMERKGVPKLVTVAEQSSADFENEVGLAEEDRVEVLGGGHWLFQINSTRFNGIVEEWFTARGYIRS